MKQLLKLVISTVKKLSFTNEELYQNKQIKKKKNVVSQRNTLPN